MLLHKKNLSINAAGALSLLFLAKLSILLLNGPVTRDRQRQRIFKDDLLVIYETFCTPR